MTSRRLVTYQDRGMPPFDMCRVTHAHVIGCRMERIPLILFGEPKKQRPERAGIRRVVRELFTPVFKAGVVSTFMETPLAISTFAFAMFAAFVQFCVPFLVGVRPQHGGTQKKN